MHQAFSTNGAVLAVDRAQLVSLALLSAVLFALALDGARAYGEPSATETRQRPLTEPASSEPAPTLAPPEQPSRTERRLA